MRVRNVMIALAFVPIYLFCRLAASQDTIKLSIRATDLVLGEISMGRAPAELLIRNSGSSPVKLATANVSNWLSTSPYWKLQVAGPLDTRCESYTAVAISTPPPGERPQIEIPAGGTFTYNIGGSGVGEAGSYTVKVEYDGTKAPKGFFKGHLSSNEAVFHIQNPSGVDAEITSKWRSLNPDKPWCTFPADMPDISQPQLLLQKYPTSIYAAWVVTQNWGTPETISPTKLKQLMDSGLYPVSNGVPDSNSGTGWRRLQQKEMAEWQIEWAQRILNNHPDFPQACRLKLILGVDSLVLGNKDVGISWLKEAGRKEDSKESAWANEFLSLWK